MPKACRICGNLRDNKVHAAREMMFGTRNRFDYLECGACGTLQLLEVPNLAAYYPKDYYSIAPEDDDFRFAGLRSKFEARLIARFLMAGKGWYGAYLARTRPVITNKFPPWLRRFPSPLGFDSSILDFGSGNGRLLKIMRAFGFRNLTGADAYIEDDLRFDGVTVFKRALAEFDQRFDLVMLHHSFEHLPDPHQTLGHIDRLLTADGTVLVRIPIINYAWEKYG
ncbi:MAG: class I SAM-dependent methyltransferase, partial [Acidobacteria bacterium]|nr:class I SAM-dependent methyltransferase [Acidobacteriota bacterium]MCA1609174.1 class I SAM-dependent methyltransferase [Acidobacteriota bacterium]